MKTDENSYLIRANKKILGDFYNFWLRLNRKKISNARNLVQTLMLPKQTYQVFLRWIGIV